ncbi:MAG TPA: aminoacyl-tRNA hydrolase [Pirellulales bacterium]
MKLVVGLGNVGKKYEGTRHNIGFDVARAAASRWGAGVPRAAFQGEVYEVVASGERVLILLPHTLMNLSGRSVREAQAFYKIPVDSVFVVCDDLNLPPGKLRIRPAGSSGGQNGLADVVRALGTDAVPRLRIGIGRPPAGWDTADYVLSRFTKEEADVAAIAVKEGVEAIETWVSQGIAAAMNRFNVGDAPPAERKPKGERPPRSERKPPAAKPDPSGSAEAKSADAAKPNGGPKPNGEAKPSDATNNPHDRPE